MVDSARFSIEYRRYLQPDATLAPEVPGAARDTARLSAIYRTMVLVRAFDAKAVALQRTGQLGTYASSLGQEAVGAAVGATMGGDDVLVPNYRDCAAQIARGVQPHEILLYWGGDERGSDYAGPREDFPVCIPVGTQNCHAVGIATAIQYRRQARAVVSTMGDGATSKGDFYESLNLAGAWKLPVVFVINNNQWAISVPRSAQTGCRTLAQKAIAGGIPGIQVDGNDALALAHTLDEALARARQGAGATLIEALTYRLCDHTTADDASRYRSDDEVGAHWKEDPIARLRKYLAAAGAWTKADEETLVSEAAQTVEGAVKHYLDTPPPPATAMFDHLYATLPAALAAQRDEAAAWEESNG